MEIREFPKNMADIPVDLSHPQRVLVSGLFQDHVTVNGEERPFLTYIPENLEYTKPCLVAALPAGEDPAAYAESMRLFAFADEMQLFILLACAPEGWSADDAAYLNALYAKAQARDYYVVLPDNIYLAGFGDAAAAVHAAASRCLDWSGIMTFGSPEFAEMDTEMTGQMPVWMQAKELTGKAEKILQYWRQRNHTAEDSFYGQGSDYIWVQNPVRRRSEINEEHAAQVRLTVSEYRPDYLETAWAYISGFCRHRGQGGKQLRYRRDPEACGAVKKTMDVDGMTRLWYEYVPAACTADEKWPLVLVMPGRGGSAETFFGLSDMSIVAEERKFIAVFPQAGIHQQKPGGIRNVSLWCGRYDGEPVDDVKFIRALIDDLAGRLPVDRTRIYACGQSSGGMMSDVLGHTAGELFAAVAAWSALRSESILHRTFPESDCGAPLLWIFGDHDPICSFQGEDADLPFTVNPEMKASFLEKLKHFGLDSQVRETWTSWPVDWCSFPDEAGVPLAVMGRVHNMAHANYPGLSWISYDQFLCQFRRMENGDLYYRGRKVQKH